jgi:hypothetical protein
MPAAEVRPEVQTAPVKAETPPIQLDVKTLEMPGESGRAEALAPRDGVRSEPLVTLRELTDHALKSVRYLASQGERTMRVRLIPESLGELRLEVTASGSAITVRMASANPAVREVLEGNLQGLRDALSQDGFDSTDVFVSADASSGENESPWMQREAYGFAGASKARGQAPGTARPVAHEPEAARGPTTAIPAPWGDLQCFRVEPRGNSYEHDHQGWCKLHRFAQPYPAEARGGRRGSILVGPRKHSGPSAQNESC